MGTLKGPILFTGSVGGIRCYYSKVLKRWIISTKGGQTKELIENNPDLARQRENMNEFKACSKWASQLVTSLSKIDHLHYGYYFPKIVAMGKSIIKHNDDGPKGYRSVESSKASRLLTTINFNKLHPFDEVLTHQYEISFSEDKKTVTLKLLGFKSFWRINWPESYASYRITLAIAQLPDYVWNKHDESYQPVIQKAEKLSVSSYSEWRSRSTDPEDIILEASFAQPALQQPGTTVVVAMGIEFSTSMVEPTAINTWGTGTMKIVECFV